VVASAVSKERSYPNNANSSTSPDQMHEIPLSRPCVDSLLESITKLFPPNDFLYVDELQRYGFFSVLGHLRRTVRNNVPPDIESIGDAPLTPESIPDLYVEGDVLTDAPLFVKPEEFTREEWFRHLETKIWPVLWRNHALKWLESFRGFGRAGHNCQINGKGPFKWVIKRTKKGASSAAADRRPPHLRLGAKSVKTRLKSLWKLLSHMPRFLRETLVPMSRPDFEVDGRRYLSDPERGLADLQGHVTLPDAFFEWKNLWDPTWIPSVMRHIPAGPKGPKEDTRYVIFTRDEKRTLDDDKDDEQDISESDNDSDVQIIDASRAPSQASSRSASRAPSQASSRAPSQASSRASSRSASPVGHGRESEDGDIDFLASMFGGYSPNSSPGVDDCETESGATCYRTMDWNVSKYSRNNNPPTLDTRTVLSEVKNVMRGALAHSSEAMSQVMDHIDMLNVKNPQGLKELFASQGETEGGRAIEGLFMSKGCAIVSFRALAKYVSETEELLTDAEIKKLIKTLNPPPSKPSERDVTTTATTPRTRAKLLGKKMEEYEKAKQTYAAFAEEKFQQEIARRYEKIRPYARQLYASCTPRLGRNKVANVAAVTDLLIPDSEVYADREFDSAYAVLEFPTEEMTQGISCLGFIWCKKFREMYTDPMKIQTDPEGVSKQTYALARRLRKKAFMEEYERKLESDVLYIEMLCTSRRLPPLSGSILMLYALSQKHAKGNAPPEGVALEAVINWKISDNSTESDENEGRPITDPHDETLRIQFRLDPRAVNPDVTVASIYHDMLGFQRTFQFLHVPSEGDIRADDVLEHMYRTGADFDIQNPEVKNLLRTRLGVFRYDLPPILIRDFSGVTDFTFRAWSRSYKIDVPSNQYSGYGSGRIPNPKADFIQRMKRGRNLEPYLRSYMMARDFPDRHSIAKILARAIYNSPSWVDEFRAEAPSIHSLQQTIRGGGYEEQSFREESFGEEETNSAGEDFSLTSSGLTVNLTRADRELLEMDEASDVQCMRRNLAREIKYAWESRESRRRKNKKMK
jgi:hypothetical protein